MTRSKELRGIEDAIAHKNEPELRWALAQMRTTEELHKERADVPVVSSRKAH